MTSLARPAIPSERVAPRDHPPAVPPDRPILLVSPHMDDAVLSCFALLARAAPVDVLTVFAGPPRPARRDSWDRVCGFRDSDEANAARRSEEREAFAGLPHRLRLLDLLEVQYLDGPRDPADAAVIAAAIADWAARAPGGIVALPAGAGDRSGRLRKWLRRAARRYRGPGPHPDHLFVRDVGLAAAVELGLEPWLYEEIPYLFGGTGDLPACMAANALGYAVDQADIAIDRGRKAVRVGAYRSQVPHLTAGGAPLLDTPAGLPSQEHYWRLSPAGSTDGGRAPIPSTRSDAGSGA